MKIERLNIQNTLFLNIGRSWTLYRLVGQVEPARIFS